VSHSSEQPRAEIKASRPYGGRGTLWFWLCPIRDGINEEADGSFSFRGADEKCDSSCEDCGVEVVVRKP
jgi:hypothetical protein